MTSDPIDSGDVLHYSGDWITTVPDSLLHADNISGLSKLLWICIKSFASPKSPCPFPGRSTLSRMLGNVSFRSFTRYKKELIDAGWLKAKQETGDKQKFGKIIYTIVSRVNDDNKSPVAKSPVAKKPHAVKWRPKYYPLGEEYPEGEGSPPLPFKKNLEETVQRAKDERSKLSTRFALDNSLTGRTWTNQTAKDDYELWGKRLNDANVALKNGRYID